ncbi:hypothetical protein FOZ60_008805 [Perkinsus olseni]|uniref:Uncharacterized protein n=1 Tax=Perkinsus olseni TaxID=32597 RepID=A0A7J6NIE2_PEROL|nr:hypothetical protein FOZ60_008805 [Perkinsus olseni]
MTIKTLQRLLITGVVAIEGFKSDPAKYYCHFHDSLQSVCFRVVKNIGIFGIFSNEISASEADPREPYYESFNEQPSRTLRWLDVDAHGEWPLIDARIFPWPVELPVRYTKVKGRFGQPGYFDVNFTDYDQPRRFKRLIPVSMYDIPLRGDPPQAEFVMHHPTACRATLRRGEYSWLRLRYDRIFEMRAYRSGSQYNFTEAGVLNGGIVRRFKGMVNGSMIEPEAFFFKLPTDSTQYGLMFTSGTSLYALQDWRGRTQRPRHSASMVQKASISRFNRPATLRQRPSQLQRIVGFPRLHFGLLRGA